MSQEALIEIAKGWVEAYNQQDWDAVIASNTTDMVYEEVATHRTVRGSQDYVALLKGWLSAFPDSHGSFNGAFVSGNTVILEVTWRGRQDGPLQTPAGAISATGKRVELPACLILEIAGQKVRAARHYFDVATMMTQLGVNAASV
jgi:steroid delta-isomerase-like uncharacterized protein